MNSLVKVIKLTEEEQRPIYGLVKSEEESDLICRLSGQHWAKGLVRVPKAQAEIVEDIKAGLAQYTIENLVWWIRHKVEEANAKGVIVGISGGIDSSVVAALCKRAFPDNSYGVIMPIHSIPEDRKYGEMLCEAIGLEYKVMDLSSTFDTLMKTAKETGFIGQDSHVLVGGNLKARLRMSTLYLGGQERGYLVVGTDNAAEVATGYFTKYGDGGVDILPISSLLKRQVRELARHLGVPKEIITKPPSAGLYQGQTDEGEMGLTYDEIDDFVLGLEVPEEVRKKIERMHRITQHKREMPPSAPAEMNALLLGKDQ